MYWFLSKNWYFAAGFMYRHFMRRLWFEYLLCDPMQIKALIEDSNWSVVLLWSTTCIIQILNKNFEKIKFPCKATSRKCFCVFSSQENLGNFICYLSCRCIRSILCVLYIINSTKCLSISVCPVLQDVPLRIYNASKDTF